MVLFACANASQLPATTKNIEKKQVNQRPDGLERGIRSSIIMQAGLMCRILMPA
jgi:hypothetical protein